MEDLDLNKSVPVEQFSNDAENAQNEDAQDKNSELKSEKLEPDSLIATDPSKNELQTDHIETDQDEVPHIEEIEEIHLETTDEEISGDQLPEEVKEMIAQDKQKELALKHQDYSKLSKEELISSLHDLLVRENISEILNDVELIKVNFYKKNKAALEKLRAKFIADGGSIENFKPVEDPQETEFKELLNRYRTSKAEFIKVLERQKEENLKVKYQIIEEIKDLINRKESINKTFQDFRELQKKWRETGLVPQQHLKDLWETYHYHVEKFYDYIKINKELRDLDLKKNLEEKIKLCEKAEDLLIEPSIIKAFQELQKLHDLWREVGPVPSEIKEEIWERFKNATSKINKKHQQHFEDLKNTQKKNLEAKTILCEKVDEINNQHYTSYKEWEQKGIEVKEMQKIWKTIGFAPKKHNSKIYQRFRIGCDQFFSRMREFYSENKEIQNNNLQYKIDLCIQAEGLKESTDWKKTTDDFIHLQKKWKEIGPVPRKQSDDIWRRFRAACDYFFQQKQQYFAGIDNVYEENLIKKNALIEEIKTYKQVEDNSENIKMLKEFQRRWAEIGFVPLKEKEKIQHDYREVLNSQFDNMEIDENKKRILKFKNKVDNLKQNPKALSRVKNDREKYIIKLKKLESNIALWENNIGFFAKSKNASAMIEEVENNIKKAKEEIILLEEKINMIDTLNI